MARTANTKPGACRCRAGHRNAGPGTRPPANPPPLCLAAATGGKRLRPAERTSANSGSQMPRAHTSLSQGAPGRTRLIPDLGGVSCGSDAAAYDRKRFKCRRNGATPGQGLLPRQKRASDPSLLVVTNLDCAARGGGETPARAVRGSSATVSQLRGNATVQPFSFASDDEHELSRGRTEVELLPLGAGDAAVIATRGASPSPGSGRCRSAGRMREPRRWSTAGSGRLACSPKGKLRTDGRSAMLEDPQPPPAIGAS